jgi:hypothetical protein
MIMQINAPTQCAIVRWVIIRFIAAITVRMQKKKILLKSDVTAGIRAAHKDWKQCNQKGFAQIERSLFNYISQYFLDKSLTNC